MKKSLSALLLVVCLLVVTLSACSENITPNKSTQSPDESSPTNESSETDPPPVSDASNVARIGETLTVDWLQITLDSVTNYVDDSEFLSDKPDEGKEFVVLWFTAKNTSEEDEHINMFYEDSYCDDFSIKSESFLFHLTGETLWGDIAAGKASKGYVAYQVPTDWDTIEFQYQPNLFGNSASKMIFKATKSDIE